MNNVNGEKLVAGGWWLAAGGWRRISRTTHHTSRIICVVLFMLVGVGLVSAQEAVEAEHLRVTGVDISAFPTIGLNLVVTDGASNPITDLSSLSLREEGIPAGNFTVEPIPIGLDLIFVVDANESILAIDDDTEQTRLDKVKESIGSFATQYMDGTQLDRVSIIVPDGDEGQFLVQEATRFPAVVDAIDGYEPEELGQTPLNDMLTMALDTARDSHDAGRFQAVVLLTDGAQLSEQLEYGDLIAVAEAIDLTFFAAILGARADQGEIANVAQLYEPTRGSHVHMPTPEATDSLYALLRANGTQAQVRYQSNLRESGQYDLELGLGTLLINTTLDLQLEPPDLTILLAEDRIERVGTQFDTPLTALQPATQPLEIQVTWSGGQVLALTEVEILVNGEPFEPTSPAIIDDTGLLRLDWDVSNLDADTYAVAVRVTDIAGLTGQSLPVAVTIEVSRPEQPPPTTTPEPIIPESDSESPDDALTISILPDQLLPIAGGIGLFLLVVGLLLAVRRRRINREVEPPRPEPTPAVVLSENPAIPKFAEPDESSPKGAGTFLTLLNPAGEDQSTHFPIKGNNITIGRDPRVATIPLADSSVSRLHARIRFWEDNYWLYDEGSASGTYLNYERVGLAPHMLQNGDEIHCGRVHLHFRTQ